MVASGSRIETSQRRAVEVSLSEQQLSPQAQSSPLLSPSLPPSSSIPAPYPTPAISCPVSGINGHECGTPTYGKCNKTSGKCECVTSGTKFGGAACDSCLYGWVGVMCNLECPLKPGETEPCSGPTNGVCVATNSSAKQEAACFCAEYRVGKYCEQSCGVLNCSHGHCAILEQSVQNYSVGCICNKGYIGDMCQIACPLDESTTEVCNGHGDCIIDNTGNVSSSKCSCHKSWTGRNCTDRSVLSDDPMVYYLVGGVIGSIVISTIVLSAIIFCRRKSTEMEYAPVTPIDDAEYPFDEEDPYY